MKNLKINQAENFGGVYSLTTGRHPVKIPCYSPRQINAFYPSKNKPEVIGVYARSHKTSGGCDYTFQYKDHTYILQPSRSYSPLFLRRKGYLPVEGKANTYILLLQPRLSEYLAFFSILILVTVALLLPRPVDAPAPNADENAVPWRGGESTSETGKLVFDGITSLKLSSESRQATVSFHNPASNQSFCIVSLWVYLDNQWQEVFQSGRIDPGMALYEVTLSKLIPHGTYPAYVKYKNYHSSTQEPLNDVVFRFTLQSE